MSLPNLSPPDNGPSDTPNAGRADRITRQERRDALRYRAAADRLDHRRHRDGTELRSLWQENRALRDALSELRAEMRAGLAALRAEQTAIRDETAEALDYLTRGEVSRNGAQATH
jgi:hypothetical protein